MENVESPIPVNLSSRNVLKELNGNEMTAKSPKDGPLADQTIIISDNCLTAGSDKGAVSENLLSVATPTDVEESSDNVAAIQSHSDVNSETFLRTTAESFHMNESDAVESGARRTSEKMLQFGVKCNNLNETGTPPRAGLQDATFISTTNNQTVVLGSASSNTFTSSQMGLQDATFVSTNSHNNQTIVMETKEDIAVPQLSQTQELSEFKANRSLSADSFDDGKEVREVSLDSPNTKQDEPTTPTDKRLPAVSAEKLFSSRKAPTFSEMFASNSPPINESNAVITTNKQLDASFVVDRTYVASEKCPNKESVNATVVLTSNNANVESGLNGEVSDFKAPTIPTAGQTNKRKELADNFMVLNSTDFDFLQSRGAHSVDPENDPRSSLLLRFDPLAGRHSLLSSAQSKQSVATIEDSDTTSTTPTNEQPSNGSLVQVAMESDSNSCSNNVRIERNGDKVISVDELLLTNKKIDTSSLDENIRKKMEEYEATQEILLKRITEKDKAITKASNVLELYEKAIAEALAAKEKLSQNYDKEHEELKTDRDVNFQHLLSLESTFADLHMKFERNVQYTGQLQEKLNGITEDKSKAEDLLKQQEFRYDKMKSHTMHQFDIANTKLEQQTRTISLDNTKLRAQIKREEIHKNAVAEELSQKKKENEELVKICDELISGQRN